MIKTIALKKDEILIVHFPHSWYAEVVFVNSHHIPNSFTIPHGLKEDEIKRLVTIAKQ